MVTSVEEFLSKVDHLENNPAKYEQLLSEVDANLHRVQLNVSESLISLHAVVASIQEQTSSDQRCTFR